MMVISNILSILQKYSMNLKKVRLFMGSRDEKIKRK